MGEKRWDVFISYGHADADWVGVLAANLHRGGIDVFLDIWELTSGDRFAGRLEEGLRNSANGILVVSPLSMSRPWVREEYEVLLREAVEHGRRLIPVLFADAELPPFLANREWVDFRNATTGPPYDKQLDKLIRALQGLPAVDRPERDSAMEWPAGPDHEVFRAAGPMQATLRVSPTELVWRDGATSVSQPFRKFRPVTVEALKELQWQRRSHSRARASGGSDRALAEVGRQLSADVLAGPVGASLAKKVAEASGLNEVVEVGLEVHADLMWLPWEALQIPDPDGAVPDTGGPPLALHHNVALFRQVAGLGPAPAYKIRGPLRVLVAIASPESQNESGELLNYEAELARIVAAVEPARRRGDACIRVLNEGSLAAIAAALTEDREGFHVLHLSCHAQPGLLVLETVDGAEDLVDAARFISEGVPPGADLPLVVLSGCSTGIATRQTRQTNSSSGGEGEETFASLGQQLLERGVPSVVAMQAPVTDVYATELMAEFYRYLATAESPDPLAALTHARAVAEQHRQALPVGSPRRTEAEWDIATLLVRGLRLPLFNRREPAGAVTPVEAPVVAEGIVVRQVGEFVGRRGEARQCRRALTDQQAGLVIHGIGGVGKSTLAAEIVRSLGAGAGLVVSKAGILSVDVVLDEIGARLLVVLPDNLKEFERLRAAAQMLRQGDVEWSDRWRVLAEVILRAVPMTVLLDNFEDNLAVRDETTWAVRDPELASFLAGWALRPGYSKLVFTSRYPFALPENTQRRFDDLHLGPLSPAETAKLVWQLPGLDALPPDEFLRAYRNVGGHPRTLEYLDALLRRGEARFIDIAERMETRLAKRGIDDPDAWMASQGRDLDSALAEAVTLAVDDIVLNALLDHLAQTPVARELVVGASVYRVPIDDTALIWQVGQEVERAPDLERRDRHRRVGEALSHEREETVDAGGLSAEELAGHEADVEAELRPPVVAPEGYGQAVRAAHGSGLITPVARSAATFNFVHRWTAQAIEQLHAADVAEAHRRAARFWRWRVERIPQSREQDVEQLIEARYHHHHAGESGDALAITYAVLAQLGTWGQYGREAELCRETLNWVPADTTEVAALTQRLGIIAHRRGDYDTAEDLYLQSLQIDERLGNEAGVATSYHQLGMVAQYRGDYDTAEARYLQSLEITERLGDEARGSASYGQLGRLAQDRGDYDTAEARYRQALEIDKRLGNQAGTSRSFHNLGMLAQQGGDYATAETRYRQSLEIDERLGDQAGVATSYHQLGVLAQERGDYDTADARYRQALEINERLGDQAGASANYHQLGMLAQFRRDYDTAEARFRQALEINVRLGNQPGVATSYSVLAGLDAEIGNDEAAIGYNLQALRIRAQIGSPQAGFTVRRLGELREKLGEERFGLIIGELLDIESAKLVVGLFTDTPAGPAPPPMGTT